MTKLRREDTADIDIKALDAVEYSTEKFDTYYGEVPPVDTELTGYVKRMWWTRTATKPDGTGNDPMLKILWVAAENEGEDAEFNDCPFWLNAPLVAGAKFRWAPFLDCYGITLKEVKFDTHVQEVDDQNGWPIERIGSFHPGEEHDEAWCRIMTEQEPYNGAMQARVGVWMPWDSEEGEPEDEGEPADDEYEDEDEGEEGEPEDEGEPEEPAEPAPARGRRSTAAQSRGATRAAKAPAATATATRASKPRAAGSAPARASSGRAASGNGARRTTKAAQPAARGRGRRSTDNEPPF